MFGLSRTLRDRYKANLDLFTSLGPVGYATFRRYQRLLRTAPRGTEAAAVPLVSRLAKHPVYCRPGTSDFWVFLQIFVTLEYSCLDARLDGHFASLRGPGLIIDCGANVGYASAYFLSRYPSCEVIAIEPDPGNYAALVRNLAPYGARARSVRAGIWSHKTSLKLAPTSFRDGSEWTRQVVECADDDPDALPATSVDDVLRDAGRDRVALLKMDVEGAEGVVFARGYEGWLARTHNLAVELHDDTAFGACREIFHRALAEAPFALSQSGELTLAFRHGQTSQAREARAATS
jgi:FkbM family methyltransferase